MTSTLKGGRLLKSNICPKIQLVNLSMYLLLEIESLGGALDKPLTPAVRDGSELALLVWVPSFPQLLGFKLAKKEDLGD